jgi:hypothetical protein
MRMHESRKPQFVNVSDAMRSGSYTSDIDLLSTWKTFPLLQCICLGKASGRNFNLALLSRCCGTVIEALYRYLSTLADQNHGAVPKTYIIDHGSTRAFYSACEIQPSFIIGTG